MLSAELKAFYRVARLGSITLAAKKLGLSQPTVTTQIRNLESQYTVELFYRGGRRLSVSDELIIGDSHDYGSDPSPFNAEQVDDWMIELAEQTLACKVQVAERWQGVYGSRGPGPFSFLRPMPGVSVALMHTGVGMSVGPAMAERNVATVLGEI